MRSVSRREFLQSVAGTVGASAVPSLAIFERLYAQTTAIAPAALAKDDDR
jgi:hypothetical protein